MPAAPHAVTRLVPFAHVADVEASLAFYSLLGFVRQGTYQSSTGRTIWAHARAGAAEIMLAQADSRIDDTSQGILFYMYSSDVGALRHHLLAHGVHDAGDFGEHARSPGKPGTATAVHGSNTPGAELKPVPCAAAFAIAYPFYMPAGQLRIHDLDGYCILVGQVA